jgi:HD-like signal output (HDOD) protein
MWGVDRVSVQAGDPSISDAGIQSDPKNLRRIAEAIKPLFADNDLTHPAVAEIFRQAVIHRSGYQAPRRDRERIAAPTQPLRAADRRKIIASRNIRLPEIPAIIFKLNDIIADPFSSADDIARVISTSPGLCAILLRIVNSAFYGFPSRIDSITRAVTVIGTKEVSALAMGITALEVFKDIPQAVFDMPAFTRHCLACGVLARVLAANGNLRSAEQMFVAGLLHDIGRLVIFRYLPQQSVHLLSEASSGAGSLYEREKAVMGFRHTDIAADLFEKWKLPMALAQNVVHHHRPTAAQDPVKAAVVHLADIIAHSLGEGKSGEWRVPALDMGAWDSLRLSPKILAASIPQAVHHLSFLTAVFANGG